MALLGRWSDNCRDNQAKSCKERSGVADFTFVHDEHFGFRTRTETACFEVYG